MSDDEDFDDDEDEIELDDASEGEIVEKVRAQTLASLKKVAKKAFALKHAELQSVMMSVAQYWNDEADDAVHSHLVASTRRTPVWPHICHDDTEHADNSAETDFCEYCHGDLGYLPFDDNGAGILGFQPYCHENGSQEESTAANYTPYAVARRAGNDVEIELVGVLYRPYEDMIGSDACAAAKAAAAPFDARAKELFQQACASGRDDGPRRVLADYLIERGDPRGEYISLALATDLAPEGRARRDELLAEHRWSWIHPLGAAIPRDRAIFERGLLAAADAFVTDQDIAMYENALAWGSVERLHFLPSSDDFVAAVMMSSLREVGPLTANGLAKLAKGKRWAIERLHVSLATPAEIELLISSRLPALRHLVIEHTTGHDAGPPLDRLVTAAWWKQLERVTWLGALAEASGWLARLPEIEPVPRIAIGEAGADGRAAGWMIALGRTDIEVSYAGWHAEASRTQLCDLLQTLPELPVVLASSAIWSPTDDDRRHIAHYAKRAVSIRD